MIWYVDTWRYSRLSVDIPQTALDGNGHVTATYGSCRTDWLLIDSLRATLLGLLDLSAAFDCVDHSLLLLRLQHNFGLVDTVLRWFTSFVTGRTLQISFDSHLSPVQSVLYGVPQGSVLGPLQLQNCRSQQNRHTSRSFHASVRWRLSSVPFVDCQRCANLGRPTRSLYWRLGSLAER